MPGGSFTAPARKAKSNATSGTAAATGTLKLFYWDSNAGDNSQFISATVTAVPKPETYALMMAGIGMVGWVSKRRKKAAK